MNRRKITVLYWGIFNVCILLMALMNLEGLFPEINFAKYADTRHVITFVVFVPFSSICFPKLNLFYIIGISLLFANGIEFAQELFTAGVRNFTWSDLWYDFLGISIGVLILLIWETINKNKSRTVKISKKEKLLP